MVKCHACWNVYDGRTLAACPQCGRDRPDGRAQLSFGAPTAEQEAAIREAIHTKYNADNTAGSIKVKMWLEKGGWRVDADETDRGFAPHIETALEEAGIPVVKS